MIRLNASFTPGTWEDLADQQITGEWSFYNAYAADEIDRAQHYVTIKTNSLANAQTIAGRIFKAGFDIEEDRTVIFDFDRSTEYVYFSSGKLLPKYWVRTLENNEALYPVNSRKMKLDTLNSLVNPE